MKEKANSHFLIVRTDSIGDVLLSVPCAKSIKNTYYDSKVTLLCKNLTSIIGERYKYIDDVIILH